MRKTILVVALLAISLARDIRVFHMTDIHAELDYRAGAPAICEERPCCRKDSIPKNETYPAGKYGDHHCDNPPQFIEETFDYFANLFEENPDIKPDYIMMTGDQCTHRKKDTQSAELNIKLVRYVFNTYRHYFGKYHTIPVFGNHDTFPEGHMLLPPENRWMTEVMAELWRDWVPEEQMENVLYGGYYTKLIAKGWRVIGLNSLWDYVENTEVEHVEDPAEQNAFAEKWLEYARQHNETVWIIAHIAAGSDVFEPFNKFYTKMMQKYGDIVAASFYGHTHDNQLYIVRDIESAERTPLHVNWVTTALEGNGGNNPAANMYIIDEETKKVKDFIVYIADIEEMRKTGQLEWKKAYSMKDAMKIKDLTPKSLAEWGERMWEDGEMFEDYMDRYHTGYYERYSCDHDCKIKKICEFLYVTKEDRDHCHESHQ